MMHFDTLTVPPPCTDHSLMHNTTRGRSPSQKGSHGRFLFRVIFVGYFQRTPHKKIYLCTVYNEFELYFFYLCVWFNYVRNTSKSLAYKLIMRKMHIKYNKMRQDQTIVLHTKILRNEIIQYFHPPSRYLHEFILFVLNILFLALHH
jgi:hypothetical protein